MIIKFDAKVLFFVGLVFLIAAGGLYAAEEKKKEKEVYTGDPAKLSVDRIFKVKDFKSKGFGPIRWLEDGSGYTTLEETAAYEDAKDIVKNDPATGIGKVLISASSLIPAGKTEPLEIKDYSWSDDGSKLLIYTNSVRVWRLETRGDYWVYETGTGRLKKLGGDAEESMMMFGKFSPDGKSFAYVYKRDIYIQDLKTMRIKRLTKTGSDTIINGTSDWVYEEEFHLRDGFSFSPDGKFIAYWNFDSSGVKEFKLINNTDSEDRYPIIMSYQYPKVGTTNSAVRIGVMSVKGGKTKWLETNDDLRNNYIPKMSWIPDTNKIVLQRMNRLQNTNKLMVTEITSGFLGGVTATPLKTIITEKDDAWIDIHDDMKWFDKGSSFTWTSERDGWRHMYMISGDGKDTKLLTRGEYDVMKVLKIDGKGGWIYYIASPDDATQSYLYRTTMDGSGKTERLTPADQPGSHSYNISKDAKWAIHTYSSYKTVTGIDMVDLPRHATARVLEDNKELREKVSALKVGFKEPFKVDIGGGVELDGWCIKPSNFDANKKYPLFVFVYGEPAAQTVRDSWGGGRDLWHSMVAEQGYIVVSIDNRGTPAPKGRAWRKSIYKQIGILASKDQAAAVKKITTTWPFIDADRVGVWGWSGGGSMTLNALFRYPDLYHTGIAVAFVSNQLNYDTIYQERYMATPDVNPEGFKNGSPITHAKNLKGNLMIVYGSGDDNCHYQNCEMLINELVKHNKVFSMMAYPNRTHSIKEYEGTVPHLYALFTRYLNENLPAGAK